jgi:two-component system, OmpR family, sensor kinase
MRRTRPWTTASRLIVALTTAVTVVLLVTGAVTILVINGLVQDRVNSRLVETSERIRASLVGIPDLDLERATVENMAKAGSAVVVLVQDSRPVMVINGDDSTAQLSVASALPDGQPHSVQDRPDLVAIRLDTAATRFAVSDGPQKVTPSAVVVVISTARETAAMHTIGLVTVAGIVVAIVTLVVLTVVIVGRGLRPLRDMSERAQAYADGNRAVRLPEAVGDSDMARLATTLNQALDAQHEAEERLRAFVADASHELRTPLTTATGWIELYLQGGLSDQERRDQAMDRAQVQLSRMRILIDELALLARLDRARPLAMEDVDLAMLAREVVEDARLMNPDRSFTVRAGGPASLRGDRLRLQQVLANLLGNAVKYAPPGTPIEVTVVPACPSDGSRDAMHTLLVTDHGPGISQPDQARIFERFWRGDTSRHRQTGGSGLGLAIVASIVAAHGGSCDVISKPGHGTTIRVRLPVTADDPAPSTTQPAHASSARS